MPAPRRGLRRGKGFVGAEVVELADGRVSSRAHLPVRRRVRAPDEVGRLSLRLRRACPRATPRSRRRPRVHAAPAGTYGCARSRSPGSRSVPATSGDASTIGFADELVYAVSWAEIRALDPERAHDRRASRPSRCSSGCILDAGDGAAWGAGFFFAAAALTDQLDGWLARRWHVESSSGRSPIRSRTG